jgi:flagellar hook-length control protein FliK
MARVNLDFVSGLLAADPPPLPGGLDPASGDSFDRHLQRARDTVEQYAADRGAPDPPSSPPPERPRAEDGRDAAERSQSPPSPEEADSPSGREGAAGEEAEQPTAAAVEGEGAVERAKEKGRGSKEETEEGTAIAAAPVGPGAAAPGNEAAGAEAAETVPSSHKGKKSPALDPAAGKAKPAGPQPSATPDPHPTDFGQKESPPASEKPQGEEIAEQAEGELAHEAPPGSATELKPAKSQAKTKTGSVADAVQPAVEAGAAGEAAAQSGQAGAEASRQTGPTTTSEASPIPQPAIQDAQAVATAPRGGAQRSGARASREGRDAADNAPVGPEAEEPAATPQKPSELREPAPPATVSAAGKQEPDRGETPDAKAEGGAARMDSQAGKEIQSGTAPASSADAQAAPGAEQADRVRFVQRVARAFEAAAGRGGPIRLRLHPPELGAIRLEISIRRGAVTARIEAETETAQRMLLDNLSGLRQRLAEHPLRVERFDVQWTGRSPGHLLQQPGGHAQGQARDGRPAPRAGAAADRQPAVPAASPPRAHPGQPASFDVII